MKVKLLYSSGSGLMHWRHLVLKIINTTGTERKQRGLLSVQHLVCYSVKCICMHACLWVVSATFHYLYFKENLRLNVLSHPCNPSKIPGKEEEREIRDN